MYLAATSFVMQPGPRREKTGKKSSNKDRSYVAASPAHAAWYCAAPHRFDSFDQNTSTWGPIAMLQCEATDPLRKHEVPVANVKNAQHGAKLIYPRVLTLLGRIDWSTPDEATSRCRPLSRTCAMGDCAHALHLACNTCTTAKDAAERLDYNAARYGRSADDGLQWPSPLALYSPQEAQQWARSQFELPASAAARSSLATIGLDPQPAYDMLATAPDIVGPLETDTDTEEPPGGVSPRPASPSSAVSWHARSDTPRDPTPTPARGRGAHDDADRDSQRSATRSQRGHSPASHQSHRDDDMDHFATLALES